MRLSADGEPLACQIVHRDTAGGSDGNAVFNVSNRRTLIQVVATRPASSAFTGPVSSCPALPIRITIRVPAMGKQATRC